MSNALTIYLIDDDKVYQFMAKKAIDSYPHAHNLKIFSDGEEAISFLKNNKINPNEAPDIIFLDLNMPIMDGWQFLEEYIKLKPGIAKPVTIYIVSSSDDEIDTERAKHLQDVSGYLIKPVEKSTFKEILNKLNPSINN